MEPAIASVANDRLTVAGLPEGVSIARRYISDILGIDHPCSEIAALLASELVTNSVRHSGSRLPGEVVTVAALANGERVRVEVTDRSGPTVPVVYDDRDAMAEGGRGLQLVAMMASDWGFRLHGDRTTTWFECRNPGEMC